MEKETMAIIVQKRVKNVMKLVIYQKIVKFQEETVVPSVILKGINVHNVFFGIIQTPLICKQIIFFVTRLLSK